jgi:hypothetical protein
MSTTSRFREYVDRVRGALAGFADESWLPWGKILFPDLDRLVRESEKAMQYAEGKISMDALLRNSAVPEEAPPAPPTRPRGRSDVRMDTPTSSDEESETSIEPNERSRGKRPEQGSNEATQVPVRVSLTAFLYGLVL